MHVSKGVCARVCSRWRMIRGDRIADGWGRKKEQPKINIAVPETSCPRVSRLRNIESRDRCEKKKNKTFRFDHFLEFSWIVMVTIFRITRWAPRTTRGCQIYIAENFPPQTLFSTFSFHLLKDLQNCKLLLLLLF